MSEGGMMKRLLLYVIPLSAIAVLVFATIAVAQSVPQGQESSQNPATGHTTDVQNSTNLPAKNEPAETKESAETKEPAETTTPAKSTAPATDTTVAVDIKDLGYAPPQLNIAPGTRIMFVNSGKQDHTATADNEVFDTGTLKPGESTWVSFRGSGSVTYHDQLHPDMKGSIVVGKDGGGGDTTAAPKQTAEEAPNEPSGAADQSALDLSKILKGIN
jgi:plastocyanin